MARRTCPATTGSPGADESALYSLDSEMRWTQAVALPLRERKTVVLREEHSWIYDPSQLFLTCRKVRGPLKKPAPQYRRTAPAMMSSVRSYRAMEGVHCGKPNDDGGLWNCRMRTRRAELEVQRLHHEQGACRALSQIVMVVPSVVSSFRSRLLSGPPRLEEEAASSIYMFF